MSNIKIKQISKSDQIIGVITCHSGKISVFRAKNNDDLLPYQRAISNTPGPEKFSIEKDDEKINIDEIICIGLVKKQLENITLKEFLDYSQNESTLHSVTKQFELEKKLDLKLEDLTKCELRRAEILKLSFLNDKIIAINLPFEPISFNLKETVAEFLLDICSNQNHTIIITSMNYRPQSWIDNENITRVEVGQNRQKTIGLGDTPSELQAMLAEVRKEAENKAPESSFLDALPSNEISKKSKSPFLFLSLPIIFLIGASYYFLNNTSNNNPIIVENTLEQAMEAKSDKLVEEKTEKKEIFALNNLPLDVKKSIIATFQGTSESINYKKQKTKSKEKSYKQNTQNDSAGDSLLQALQKTSNTAKESYGNSDNPPRYVQERSYGSTPSASTISNERREALRQKFKEALMRATKR